MTKTPVRDKRVTEPTALTPTRRFYEIQVAEYAEFRARAETRRKAISRDALRVSRAAQDAAHAGDAEALAQAVNLLAAANEAALSLVQETLDRGTQLAALLAGSGPGLVRAKATEASRRAAGKKGGQGSGKARAEDAETKKPKIMDALRRARRNGSPLDAKSIVERFGVTRQYAAKLIRAERQASA